MALLLLIMGAIIALVGFAWIVVMAFQESLLWGLACFFCKPIGTLIFVVLFWQEAKKPFFVYLAGALICGLGYAMNS